MILNNIRYKKHFYRYILLFLLFYFLLSLASKAYGEYQLISEETTPNLEYLDREDGLSNLSVSSIIEDRYGILWFGTQGGLNRYDGKTMTTYRSNPFDREGLLHNLIQTMTYDEFNHELWIGTYQGISRYNIYEDSFVNYTVEENNLSDEVVVSILLNDGIVWVGTLDGLNKLDPITHEIKNYPVVENAVRDLLVGSNEKLYLATYDGLYYFDDVNDSLVKIPLDLPSLFVMTLDELEPGILTLGLWDGGLATVDLKTNQVNIRTFDDNRVYTFLKTSDQTQWIGTWGGGLFSIDNQGNTYHYPGTKELNDLPHNVVYSLYQSQSGILWIGTNGGGIVKINPRKRDYTFLRNNPEDINSLSQGKINLLHRDIKGNLWIAVYNTGLERYDSSTGKIHKYSIANNPSLGNNVTSAIELSQNEFLVGSEIGLSIYNFLDDKFYPYDIGLDYNIIYALERQGDLLWIGTYQKGLYAYDLLTKKLTHYGIHDEINVLSDNLVYDVHVDHKNRLWVATNNGLNLKLPGQNNFTTFYKASEDTTQLPNNNIRVIFEDASKQIWIGTGSGLSLYQEEEKTFKSFTESDGLSNNMIVSILQHNNGDLWISTSDGLSIINPITFFISTLTPEDGIGGYEFTSGHLKEKSGTLLFTGVHGITSIPTDFLTLNAVVPKFYIADIKVFQQSLDAPLGFFNNQELTFNPSENMLTFNFLALDYDAPDKTNYFYKLTPLNSNWISIGSNDYITYSNLKPGDYTLWAYGESSRGVASEAVSVRFKILKPWYLTWIAFIVYFIVLIFIIYVIIKLREGKFLRASNRRLQELSIKDALTGVYNRRYFEKIMEQQLQLAKRSHVPMGMLMIDIDDFKNINDTQGHLAGDEALKLIAHTIENLLQRSTDFVSRYGGDEFAIGLYDTPLENILDIARSIQEQLVSCPATISIGIHSGIPTEDDTVSDLIKKADFYLYESKAHGKNRISYDTSQLHNPIK